MKAKNSPIPDFIELTIDSLSYFGGRGVGRHDGVVVFVPNTAPGDRIRARVTARKPRFLEAQVVEILEPSKHRREPPCPVATKCGGCTWQHVNYSAQIEAKEKILSDSLRKLEKVFPIKRLPFVPAPQEFFYRNRVQLQVRGSQYGFFAQRSRDLIPIESCWIAEKALNQEMPKLSGVPGTSKRVELSVDGGGKVSVNEGERDPETALFGQVNSAQNEKLKILLIEAIRGTPDWYMDLYCGAGNLTMPLHERFPDKNGVGIEYSTEAIRRAQKLGLYNVEWFDGDVAHVLKRLEPRRGSGLIVLDPPRVGLNSEAIQQISRHRPTQLLYVSCNPTTFARDAERFFEIGFKCEQVQGLDMFPQTEHVELLASFCAAR